MISVRYESYQPGTSTLNNTLQRTTSIRKRKSLGPPYRVSYLTFTAAAVFNPLGHVARALVVARHDQMPLGDLDIPLVD